MHKYGLIGETLHYSFSKSYFTSKFENEKIDAFYENFEFPDEAALRAFLQSKARQCKGLNVTIPYKETVIPYLYRLQKEAKEIGAVNTIKISSKGNLIGYNTDTFGFSKSLKQLGDFTGKQALILGTGGASKAVAYSLKKLGVRFQYVSRNPSSKQLSYKQLDQKIITSHTLIINTTPLGTVPAVEEKPPIPYNFITNTHTLFDLVYNPAETAFLKEGKKRGATISNGNNMLVFQAEKAWEIWNR